MKQAIRDEAIQLGFDLCGFTRAEPAPNAVYLRQFLEEGQHGEMDWLARDPDRRMDPRKVLPSARSVIVLGLNYWQPHPSIRGRIATYALGKDYHDVMGGKLRSLMEWIEARFGGEHRLYVDTGPVMERPLSQQAGLGWQGKSTILISRQYGPWLLLAEILSSLELVPDETAKDHCGSCSRCLDACPTKAIIAPYRMDARRCISYLTIELKGSIPEHLRPLIGDRLYGCDECLLVCPWNRFAQLSREVMLRHPNNKISPWDLHEILRMDEATFNEIFRGSPIRRIKRRGLARNACVVLGNIGTEADLPVLNEALSHDEPLVQEHAAWAIQEIKKRKLQPLEFLPMRGEVISSP